MNERKPSCHIVNEGCQYPPAHEPLNEACRSRCFGCGLSVCLNCSRIRTWYLWPRKRVCDHCHEESVRMAHRVTRLINNLDREITRISRSVPKPRKRRPSKI